MYSAALCGSCVEKMEGEAQAATWLVLVGMTDRPGANYIRLWRSGWLPFPPPYTPVLLLRSLPACPSTPLKMAKVVGGALVELQRRGHWA
ncbi:hypothetical protein PBY51_018726 [Eleginops maclovinus]|uniref:Uncharacterized protein n=1 Tax=Eleginops maclovinus TaxID=56733 RepID=A0AAN7Y8W3_ELEMC|nr:hypothetical protein PBY51_018726 [Eleginops maclovinus]